MTTQVDKAALIARLVKIQSVGGSLLSNATTARKLAEAVTIDAPAPTPVPDPDPVPAPDSTPMPTGGKPGPSNTGVPAGTVLSKRGDVTVTTAGTVLEALDVTGTIYVKAANVTIRRCRVNGSGPCAIWVQSGNAIIEDCEVLGAENGIGFGEWVGRRLNIHGTYGDGVKLGSNTTLQDSWIHDLTPAAGAHADGAQVQSGVTNLMVRHNTIDLSTTGASNAALFIAPDLGPSTPGPVTITDNWLDGGNFTLFCVDGNNGQYFIGGITITNNRFGRAAQYGPMNINVPVTSIGNVWDDTGLPL